MTVQFFCPRCQQQLQAPEDKVGAKVQCPGCKNVFQIPSPPPPLLSAAIQEDVDPLPVKPVRRSAPARRDREEDYDEEPRRRRRRVEEGPYEDCPHCGCPGFAKQVSYTWWGGFIGPAILHHVRCDECRSCYNGRTGRDNTVGIAIYTVVCVVIGLAILGLVLLFTLKR